MKLSKQEKEKLMGEIISVTHKLKRTFSYKEPRDWQSPIGVNWKEEKLPETKRGWIVGFRNKPNGKIYPDTAFKGGSEWIPKAGSGVQAIMVVFSPNHNPIPCPLSGVHSPLIRNIKRILEKENEPL